jgi:hypothetical protein
MRKYGFLCAMLIGGLAGSAIAQDQASATLDGKTISVKYAAPSMKGRKIFGATVPYGKVWEIGENAPAALHTESDLAFFGLLIPKGDYSLYVLPDATAKWQLIVNKQTGPKAAAYNQKLDMGRVPMTITKSPTLIEKCRVTITKSAAMAGKLELAWENTIATIPFSLDFVPADREW